MSAFGGDGSRPARARLTGNLGNWPDAPTLLGRQIQLEPLRAEHAQEMAPLLDDPHLHVFIGGAARGLPLVALL